MKQLLLAAFLCACFSLHAQITWMHYDTSNSGIPGQEAISVAEDSLDNIWIGTYYNGVSMFDGTNWTTYDTSNSGISDNWVRNIYIGPDNKKYFATGNGISVFDGVTWTLYNPSNSLMTHPWTANVTLDDNGNLWTGTPNELLKFDGITWTVWNPSNSTLPGPVGVNTARPDHNGNVWITTGNANTPCALYKFDGTTFTPLPILGNVGAACKIDSYGNTWISCINNGGVGRYNGTSWLTYTMANSSLPGAYCNDVMIDSYDHKWITDYTGHLSMTDGVNWTIYNYQNSPLPNGPIGRTLQDHLGRIWITTAHDGVHVMDNPALGISVQSLSVISVFPNPAAGEIHFSAGSGEPISSVQLLNMNGQLIRETFAEMKQEELTFIPDAEIPNGMYMYRLLKENGDVVCGKIEIYR